LGIGDKRKADELTAREIKNILDQAADAGCLWLLLTGGEVLLREDFGEIYLYALKKGMFVEVFTNATLINERSAALFVEFPPLGIDISFYGSNSSLHDRVSGVAGSFKKMIRGIEWLKKNKVRFSLKTVLMTINYADLAKMRDFAKGLGAEFRYDTLICPRADGGMLPAQYRLSPEQMAGLDIEEDYEACEQIFSGFWNKKLGDFMSCGAGSFAFNINPYGVLSPCTMFGSFQYPLRQMPFGDSWKKLVADYDKRKNEFIAHECRLCSMLLICPNCPAWSELEAKSLNKKVDYICEYAKTLERQYFTKKEECGYGKEILSETGD